MTGARRGKRRGRLPGDATGERSVHQMIRVDQAGEYGAIRIYQGQLRVLGRSPSAPVIRRMAEQEQRHLDAFNALMVKRRVRPTMLMPLWHVAGFALGAGTALLGERAAMACTVAVEEVIDEHYARQAEALGAEDKELKSVIEEFRDDEIAHGEVARDHGATDAPAYEALSAAIKAGSRLAIWLSTRI